MVDDRSVLEEALETFAHLQAARPSIYDPPALATSGLFYTPSGIEVLLNSHFGSHAEDLCGLPVRTRSKVAKRLVCEALGYQAPSSFAKTKPRFPHANLDVYVQQSNNLQVWNQEVDAARRYAVVLTDNAGMFRRAKVIPGSDLAQFDTTGVLTRKFQANRRDESVGSRLVSATDTADFIRELAPSIGPLPLRGVYATDVPVPGKVLTVEAVYRKLLPLVGKRFVDPGITQERNRGTVVHREACIRLGLDAFADNGQFPDVLCQAVEVKLQLARTVDLGLELPISDKPLASLNGLLAARDVRFAIFYASREGSEFILTSLVVAVGADFFSEFRQFGGNVSNAKLQLRLPRSWFDGH